MKGTNMKPPYYPDWRNPNSSSIPVQVAWAETPKPPRKLYHILEPGDVLQSHDEVWTPGCGDWSETAFVGAMAGRNSLYRREVKI